MSSHVLLQFYILGLAGLGIEESPESMLGVAYLWRGRSHD